MLSLWYINMHPCPQWDIGMLLSLEHHYLHHLAYYIFTWLSEWHIIIADRYCISILRWYSVILSQWIYRYCSSIIFAMTYPITIVYHYYMAQRYHFCISITMAYHYHYCISLILLYITIAMAHQYHYCISLLLLYIRITMANRYHYVYQYHYCISLLLLLISITFAYRFYCTSLLS